MTTSSCCDAKGVCSGGTLVSACGSLVGGSGGGMGSGGGTGTEIALNDFNQQYVEATCQRRARCGFDAPDAGADCAAVLRSSGRTAAEVLRGSLVYDARAASACLAEARAVTCEINNMSLDLACAHVELPAAGPGAVCTSTSQCSAPNQACEGTSYCTRRCVAAGGADAPCSVGGWCNASLSCDFNSRCKALVAPGNACPVSRECDGNGICVNGTCVRLPQAGQPCTSDNKCAESATCAGGQCVALEAQGAMCFSSHSCLVHLACLAGTCRPRRAQGATCREDDECQKGMGCDRVTWTCAPHQWVPSGGPCDGVSTCIDDFGEVCRGLTYKLDGGRGTAGVCALPRIGDPCTRVSPCPLRATCGPTQTCVPATAGIACAYSSNCIAGEFCDSQGVCRPLVASGQLCTSDECLPAQLCLDTSAEPGVRRCRSLAGAGQPCANTENSCQFPYRCTAGTCQRAGHLGEQCLMLYGCIDGACLGADGGPTFSDGVCAPKRSLGATCRRGLDCQTGDCDRQSRLCVDICR